MSCKNFKDNIPDYLLGELDPAGQDRIQKHAAACPTCRAELENLIAIWTKLGVLPEEQPGEGLRARFYTMLEAYKQGLEQHQPGWRWKSQLSGWLQQWWPQRPVVQFGLTFLLVAAALTAGYFLRTGTAHHADISSLRREVNGTRQMLAVSLLEQSSASERLRGINLSARMETPNAEMLEALLFALENDPSVNIRLAAVDALYLFRNDPIVREGILRTLDNQESPLVQIALIELASSLREERAAAALKSFMQNRNLIPDVRLKAEEGIQRIGF